MGFEWFNEIDRVVWHFEAVVERLAGENMLGMAPSAGDEARATLRRRSSADGSPLKMLDDVEGLSEADVNATAEALAEGAVEAALARNSRHVTREDVKTALNSSSYPWVAR